jgi:hypothetical protein
MGKIRVSRIMMGSPNKSGTAKIRHAAVEGQESAGAADLL